MGEWVNISVDIDDFSEEEQRLLLALLKSAKLEPYCILALKTAFSRYLNPEPEQPDVDLNTIMNKLDTIEERLKEGVVAVNSASTVIAEQSSIQPVAEITEPVEIVQETTSKKSNAKLNKLKKLRGG